MWANPASLAKRTSMEAAAAIHFITPSMKFQNSASQAAFNQPLGGNGGDAGGLNIVPNMYIAVPINKQWTFGLGLNAPFGLVTEYDDSWLGRYQAVKSDIKTMNVNPAFSFRPTDNIAIGFGANWQKIDATFTNMVNYSGAIANTAQAFAAGGLIPADQVLPIIGSTAGLDSKLSIDGDDDAWGWNIGILVDLNKNARIGMSYRSEIKYKIGGTASFTNPVPTVPSPVAPYVGAVTTYLNSQVLYNSDVTADVTMPAIANVSLFYQLNDRWDLMGDVQWTGWSSISELKFTRSSGTVLGSTPENFDDAWRIAVGANYRHTDQWMFRGGIAFDQSPVNNTDRTPRLPDDDRWWLSLGAQYKHSNNLKFDAGFTYVFVDSAPINQNAGSTTANGLISGDYNSNVMIFSLQGTYTF